MWHERLRRQACVFWLGLLWLGVGMGQAWGQSGGVNPTPVVNPVAEEREDVRAILQLLESRQRKVEDAGGGPLVAGPVVLGYTRDIKGARPLSVAHLLYYWDPDHGRLELKVLSGSGRDSVSVLDSGKAWVRTEGEKRNVSPEELKVKLQSYRLQSLLKPHLEPHRQLLATMGGVKMRSAGREVLDGQSVLILAGGNGEKDAVRVVLEEKEGRIRSLAYRTDEGLLEFRYQDFRIALPGVELPFLIQLFRDGSLEDTVRMTRIEVLSRGARGLLEEGVGGVGTKSGAP